MGERVAPEIFVDRQANDRLDDWLADLGREEGPGTDIG
jgi:hypothetical protein